MEDELHLLSCELSRIIEAGIQKQLNNSFLHSPFRLFYKLFKKTNPQLIERIKQTLANDIEQTFLTIEGWNLEIFHRNEDYTDEGDLMIKRCYNIGIKLVKQINVKTAFKALKDKNLQQEIYTHILEKVREKAIRTIEESKISKKL